MPERTPVDLTTGRQSFSRSINRSKLDPPLPATASRRARIGRTTWRLIHGLYLHDSLEAASGMAFHFFLSLMPLLVVLGFLLGHLVKAHGVDVLLDPLLEATPSMATQVVRHELERLAGQNGALAPLGMLGFVWLSSSGVHGLINAFERAARSTKRPWWQKRVIAIGWSIASVTTLCALARRAGDRGRLRPPGRSGGRRRPGVRTCRRARRHVLWAWPGEVGPPVSA